MLARREDGQGRRHNWTETCCGTQRQGPRKTSADISTCGRYGTTQIPRGKLIWSRQSALSVWDGMSDGNPLFARGASRPFLAWFWSDVSEFVAPTVPQFFSLPDGGDSQKQGRCSRCAHSDEGAGVLESGHAGAVVTRAATHPRLCVTTRLGLRGQKDLEETSSVVATKTRAARTGRTRKCTIGEAKLSISGPAQPRADSVARVKALASFGNVLACLVFQLARLTASLINRLVKWLMTSRVSPKPQWQGDSEGFINDWPTVGSLQSGHSDG
jgi:hypothetical protein